MINYYPLFVCLFVCVWMKVSRKRLESKFGIKYRIQRIPLCFLLSLFVCFGNRVIQKKRKKTSDRSCLCLVYQIKLHQKNKNGCLQNQWEMIPYWPTDQFWLSSFSAKILKHTLRLYSWAYWNSFLPLLYLLYLYIFII